MPDDYRPTAGRISTCRYEPARSTHAIRTRRPAYRPSDAAPGVVTPPRLPPLARTCDTAGSLPAGTPPRTLAHDDPLQIAGSARRRNRARRRARLHRLHAVAARSDRDGLCREGVVFRRVRVWPSGRVGDRRRHHGRRASAAETGAPVARSRASSRGRDVRRFRTTRGGVPARARLHARARAVARRAAGRAAARRRPTTIHKRCGAARTARRHRHTQAAHRARPRVRRTRSGAAAAHPCGRRDVARPRDRRTLRTRLHGRHAAARLVDDEDRDGRAGRRAGRAAQAVGGCVGAAARMARQRRCARGDHARRAAADDERPGIQRRLRRPAVRRRRDAVHAARHRALRVGQAARRAARHAVVLRAARARSSRA